MNGSREGFCWRGRGRSFHVDGLKTEKAWGPAVESLVQGIWRLRVSETGLGGGGGESGFCETCNMNTITRHVYLINKEVCICVCMLSIINNGD